MNSNLRWEMTTKGNDCEEIICKYTDIENHYRVVVIYNRDKKVSEYTVRPIVSYNGDNYIVDIVIKHAMFTNVASLEETLIHMADRINNTAIEQNFVDDNIECKQGVDIYVSWPNHRMAFNMEERPYDQYIGIIIGDKREISSESSYLEIFMDTVQEGKIKIRRYYPATEEFVKFVKL